MDHALVVAEIAHSSGLPEDNVTNSFAFGVSNLVGDTVAAGELAACVQSFYNDVQASSRSVASYLGQGLSRAVNACMVRVYNITGLLGINPATGRPYPHGSPVLEVPWTLGAVSPGEFALPEEVAMVATLRGQGYQLLPVEVPDQGDADAAPDRPRQRATGRIYLGPLSSGTVTPVANQARPNSVFRDTILDAAEGLYDDAETFFHAWGVWSRKNAEVTPLEAVQVDDAFDTQRRRGVAPTSRTTRVVEP